SAVQAVKYHARRRFGKEVGGLLRHGLTPASDPQNRRYVRGVEKECRHSRTRVYPANGFFGVPRIGQVLLQGPLSKNVVDHLPVQLHDSHFSFQSENLEAAVAVSGRGDLASNFGESLVE